MAKLHPLHTPEMLAQCARDTGEYFDQSRCTGRSTVQALNCIAQAMQGPHKWHPVRDHHGTEASNEHLLSRIVTMLSKLGLQHFTMRSHPAYICFGNAPKFEHRPAARSIGERHGIEVGFKIPYDSKCQGCIYRSSKAGCATCPV